MAKRSNESSGMWILAGLIAVIAGLGILGTGAFRGMGTPTSERTTREVAMSCTTDPATKFHIHPELEILIGSAKQELPANIGVKPLCMNPLHTHDATGVIHVESPEPRDFTLGDFFAVWDKPFSKDQVLDSRADDTHEVVMTVDGQPSTEFENLVLRDKQKVRIEYRAKQ